jgi:uncharacterized protein YqhQ
MELIGGQAVVEGVMMISPKKVAISVRNEKGKIVSKVEERESLFRTLRKVFFVRGIFALVEMLRLGVKALSWSSNQQLKKEEQISSGGMAITMLISFALGIGLFVALPLWVAGLITEHSFWFNLLEGILRMLIFLAYVLIIAQMNDVKRLFEYHGAEHMAVHCYEAKKPLEVEHVRRFSTIHPRCGTAFIFLVFLVSLIIFSFIWSEHWWLRFGLRLALIPLVAGIAYELLRLGSKYHDRLWFRWLLLPGLWFQKITTQEPDRKQIEVALTSLKKVL